ncbi:MAG: DUF1846 domain-containing protein [Lentisphaeria bacterium]
MPQSFAFDNNQYLAQQRQAIISRAEQGNGRLYLEFGGKLIGDFHAARVLPGYDPNVKIRLLQQLQEKADIILCIHAEAIEKKKIRADFGIPYDKAVLKLIDDLRENNIAVTAIVITRFSGQATALAFQQRLQRYGLKVFLHQKISGYPNEFEEVVSPEGFGQNPYIPVTRPLVVVTGPGPCSGKMATCLNQIYHESQQGQAARYAKFETFPVWNLPLNHPLNIAYEAATADLSDNNAIDNFHYDAYGIVSINYNRDLQTFPLLRTLLNRITGNHNGYQSPTDMGVNCISSGICDDPAIQQAAREEIIRRYFQYYAALQSGQGDEKTFLRSEEILHKADLRPEDRKVVKAARQTAKDCEAAGKGDDGIFCGAAIRLRDGTIISGKNSPLMHSPASMILNAGKHLAELPESQHLLLPDILESVANFKKGLGSSKRAGLDLSETLIALVVSASRDLYAKRALDCLHLLEHCDVHLSHIPGGGDEAGLRHLGCSYTYDPISPTRNLFA